LNAKVDEYLLQIPKIQGNENPPKSEESLEGNMYYARKDTISVQGNIILGNWVMGNASLCCTAPGIRTLLLTSIADLGDIGPCPAGGTIVRAVMK
jgi:hypothetical protein